MPRHNGRDPARDPRAFLGEKLKQGRTRAGYASQDALAARLGFDRTVITKAETGERPPTPEVLAAWCQACGLDLDIYNGLAELARSSDGPVPTWFETWLEAERDAQSLQIWSPMVLPGLLQTADYARALFLATQSDTSDDAIDALVAARLDRQVILDSADSPDVSVVLEETALNRLIGSPAIMHDALAHVAETALRPRVVIQVVPAAKGAHAGLGGAFDIASAETAPGVLRMDGVEDTTTETRSLVRKHRIAFNRIRGDALSADASRDLILKVTEQWKTT